VLIAMVVVVAYVGVSLLAPDGWDLPRAHSP
jgi:hypothetical protein